MPPTTASRAPPGTKPRIGLCGTLGRRAAVLLCGLALGCKRESAPPPPEPSARPALVRGQAVIVERTGAVFEERRVLEVSGPRLRVDSADGGDSVWIASADAYVIGQSWKPAAGALAICRPRT